MVSSYMNYVGLYWLNDKVFPYVYDVGIIDYVNEDPTWVTCSWLRYYVWSVKNMFDAYGPMIGLLSMCEVMGHTMYIALENLG